jgi:hypothetical protein
VDPLGTVELSNMPGKLALWLEVNKTVEQTDSRRYKTTAARDQK